MQNPIFCLSKFKRLSTENRKDWIKAIQSVKSSDIGIAIISYLKWKLKKKAWKDLPSYSSPIAQYHSRKTIREICNQTKSSTQFPNYIKILKILIPLTDNPVAPDKYGWTPIHYAVYNGHTKIVKILAPLTDNPNAANKNGSTPIHKAASNGLTEIVKILAPLTDNPNAANICGNTPIFRAAINGHTEIVKILAPLTENPNTALLQMKLKSPNEFAQKVATE